MLTPKMKKFNLKSHFLMVLVLGATFGLLGYLHTLNELYAYSLFESSSTLNMNDVFIRNFLHGDFERFTFIRRDNPILILSFIVYYFIGTIIISQPFLKKEKAYLFNIFSRCKDRGELFSVLMKGTTRRQLYFQLSYLAAFTINLLSIRPTFVTEGITFNFVDLILILGGQYFVFTFLKMITFLTFIKTGESTAILTNILCTALIFLFSVHVRNIVFFDETFLMVWNTISWGLANLFLYYKIKFSMSYEFQ